MKFILSIFALLTIVFIVGCSAKDSNDKLSSSEIRKLGKKYGGVYVFNKEFEKEITIKEKIRREAELAIVNASKTDAEMRKNLKGFDKKFPQTLSNGKKYYTDSGDYGREYNKYPKIPNEYREKIINFIGQENWNKHIPALSLEYFYVLDNDKIVPITIGVIYKFQVTKYGLFGDEGRGFRLTDTQTRYVKDDNIFYMQDLEDK